MSRNTFPEPQPDSSSYPYNICQKNDSLFFQIALLPKRAGLMWTFLIKNVDLT